ncbi:MAG TPA: VWA domain-containing protein [Candidatus Limnocylindrales bacterium]|nr:VWA domain-containing protein [Candidatus Limnocylindrales bacterium]
MKERTAQPTRLQHQAWLGACAVMLVAVAGFVAALPTFAQQAGAGPEKPPVLNPQRIEKGKPLLTQTEMTLVNVTVTDPYSRLVTGLEQENFRVFEDGVEQEIVRFSSEDVPVSIGVIFDMSNSMSDKIDKSRLAAVQFFRTANPQDEFFLVDFNDRAQLVSPFTASVEELQNRLMFTSAHGMTAMLDGIYLGLSQMKGAHNTKKALLIISDGGDNHSRYTETDIRKFVQEADVQIYAIGLYEPDGGPTIEEREGPGLLGELTQMTGGRTFSVQSLNDLPDIATKISMELRNQYVLGYKPSNHAHDGKWRKIKVKLRPPKGLPPLNVYARTGYFAPGH